MERGKSYEKKLFEENCALACAMYGAWAWLPLDAALRVRKFLTTVPLIQAGNSTAVQGAVADDAPYQDIYAYIQTPSDNPDKVTIRYATMASEDTLYGQAYTRRLCHDVEMAEGCAGRSD